MIDKKNLEKLLEYIWSTMDSYHDPAVPMTVKSLLESVEEAIREDIHSIKQFKKEIELLESVPNLNERTINEKKRRLELARFYCKNSEDHLSLSTEIKHLLNKLKKMEE
jgi:hypothetical protein